MLGIITALQGLIAQVQKNFLSSLGTVLMLIALIVVFSARGNIATFLERNPTAAQERVRFDHTVKADSQINQALENIRQTLNADRVMIRQFHNGRADLTGLPFSSVATTYAAMAAGVTLVDGSYASYPLSTINELLAKMFPPDVAPRCVTMSIRDINDPAYLRLLESNGVAVWYNCPILNLRGQPIGFIVASYLTETKERPSDEDIFRTLSTTGERAVGYLDAVMEQEKRPWYVSVLGNS